MALRVSRRYFYGPPIDEVALSESARERLKSLSSPPTAEEILELNRTEYTDLATRVFFEGIMASFHGDFVRRLKTFPSHTPTNDGGKVKLLVLPGMFYREHPEIGADGQLAIDIARRFGFAAEIINTQSTGSVGSNSQIIREHLARETSSSIWLLSLSKGTSDVRHYLQNNPSNSNLKGWINVAGIVAGAPLADRRLATRFNRAVYRGLCLALGVDYQGLQEMTTTHVFWRNTQWPAPLDVIHVVAVPLGCHIQGKLRSRHKRISAEGPNDGFVLLTDVLGVPGHIVPLWGADHLLRTPQLSPLLYQLFHYIACNTGDVQNHESTRRDDNRTRIAAHVSADFL